LCVQLNFLSGCHVSVFEPFFALMFWCLLHLCCLLSGCKFIQHCNHYNQPSFKFYYKQARDLSFSNCPIYFSLWYNLP
jgi:hypothetical protein